MARPEVKRLFDVVIQFAGLENFQFLAGVDRFKGFDDVTERDSIIGIEVIVTGDDDIPAEFLG